LKANEWVGIGALIREEEEYELYLQINKNCVEEVNEELNSNHSDTTNHEPRIELENLNLEANYKSNPLPDCNKDDKTSPNR